MDKSKKYGCIAEMEHAVETGIEKIETGIIGYFGKDPIIIKGKLFTKGYFPRWCIRWTSREGKGLFGKGLIGYSGKPLDQSRIKELPICR